MFVREKYFKQIDEVLKLKKSIFFTGSRQVGKSTLMKLYLEKNDKKFFYANFDEIFSYGLLEFKNIQDFINYLNIFYKTDVLKYDFIVFDEIIRVKNFNILLKALIDKYKDKIFFCSASWEYEIVENIIEWLAGRIVKIQVYPLDFTEFLQFKWIKSLTTISCQTFDILEKFLKEYITFGSYPEVVLTEDINWKKLVLKSIVDSIFQKDILKLVKEDKILDLTKFAVVLRNNIWSLFSYEQFANKLWIKVNDLKKFVYALEKIWLLFRLNPFYTDKKLEITTKQKVYINDFWVYNYLMNLFLEPELDGKYIEQFVFSQLKFNLGFFNKLYFYRKQNETEIDFIYEKDWRIIPIEVKSWNSDNVPKVFKSFCAKYNDRVDYFIKTTKCLFSERQIENCKVKIIPYLNILDEIIY